MDYKIAGFVTRLLATIIDLMSIFMTMGLIIVIANTTADFFKLPEDITLLVRIFATGVAAIVPFTYHFIFLALVGQTPGKIVMGIRVLKTNGETLSLRIVVQRIIFYYLVALPLFAGFVWVLVYNKRRGWHDHLAGTIVVFTDEAQIYHTRANQIRQNLEVHQRKRV